ncbi:MAG: SDR family NAD(P)-dependent oxidoreductase, partial [Rhodospirillales bacterium]
MDCRMDGRVALITGSSRGLGRAMALKFADAGADVVICSRREDELEKTRVEVEAAGAGKVAAFQADVSRAEDINRLIEGAVDALGPIDVLINNAG